MLKGICMMAILLFHTEIYYNGSEIINYNLYVCDALVIFFFLSGYHFYKTNWVPHECNIRRKDLIHKYNTILHSIILPYFIFTAIIAFPKAIAHNTSMDFTDILIKIITGNASWFVAALAVAEILFSTILYICKGKNSVLSISAITAFAISIFLSTTEINLWWQFENACMAFSLLYLGYLFHEKEIFFNRFNNTYYTLFLLLILVIIKTYIATTEITLFVAPIIISNVPIFIINTFVSILFMVNVSKLSPRVKIIEWTGEHSLVYYFLCGGVPFTVSTILNKAGLEYNGKYYRIIIVFILVYLITSIMTYIIYKYLPFLVLKQSKK